MNDMAHGIGIQIQRNGDVYAGDWDKNVCHGLGEFDDQENGINYVGPFVDGLRHGQGVEVSPEGTYKGDFYNNMKQGNGAFTFLKNGSIYTGEFLADLPDGKGQFKWKDGRIYIGDFIKGKMHGHGTFKWPDGRCYKGGYKDGLKHGQGEFYTKNGSIYSGGWKDGIQEGLGFFFKNEQDKDGRKGLWKNGQREKWVLEESSPTIPKKKSKKLKTLNK
jgi:hypothetical protein